MSKTMSLQQAMRVIADAPLSPAAKRKLLLSKGVVTEYQPHQGKREIERRRKQRLKLAAKNLDAASIPTDGRLVYDPKTDEVVSVNGCQA